MNRWWALTGMMLFAFGSAEAQQSLGPAPTGRCALNAKFDRVTTIQLPSGQRNSYLGGNVVATCPSQGLVLKSDSLEAYGDEGRFFFIGHVDYSEPRLKLRSDFLTYFQRDERILAYLNVDAELPTGSTLKGSHLEFWRAIPNVRQQHANSVSRPTITIVEKDSAGRAQPPITVTGNTIWLEGDSTVASSGEVVVVRPELTASGDSLFLDGGSGLLRLMRSPRVLGTKGRTYTLIGQTIDVLSKQRKLDRVLAKSNAEATSQDLDLKSDTIDLRVSSDVLQRAVAWGGSRARAVSSSQSIIADSIDVLMPNQKLREMHALRSAVAEGSPDTTKFRTADKDRLTGDTIVAYFDTTAAAVTDSTSKPKIRQLISSGNATSIQHLPPRDTTVRTPAIVYVFGRLITVSFDSGAVKRVRVEDQKLAAGVYLEPESDSTRARRERTAPTARPSAGARPTAPAPAPLPAPSSTTTTPIAEPPKRP
ncbi:MAG: hypothetical protein JWL95_1238 [Gemmatimonadetes bacterium]|nr:hypothetical protein [Gemmatimonadota bacterium]